MDHFLIKYGKWALVAGAAEGIGEAFSEALASRKMNLVMVDFNAEALKILSARLKQQYHTEIREVLVDLASEDSLARIKEATGDLDCRLMIYVAAFSKVKPFLKTTTDELERYIQINTRSLILLSHDFLKGLTDSRKPGGLMMISSLGGIWGTQLLACYGATKAFTYILAEALHHEMKYKGIDVMACVAGATSTPSYLNTGPEYGFIRPGVMEPRKVAALALQALGKKAFFIPGLSNKINYFVLSRMLPRKLAVSLFNRTTRKMYSKYL